MKKLNKKSRKRKSSSSRTPPLFIYSNQYSTAGWKEGTYFTPRKTWTPEQLNKAATLGELRATLLECPNTTQFSDKQIGNCPNQGCNETIVKCFICESYSTSFECYSLHYCKKKGSLTPTRASIRKETETKNKDIKNTPILCNHNIKISKRSVKCEACSTIINICSCGKHLDLKCFCGHNRIANTQACFCGPYQANLTPGAFDPTPHNCLEEPNSSENELIDNTVWIQIYYGPLSKLAHIRDKMRTNTKKYIFKIRDQSTTYHTPDYDLNTDKNLWLMTKLHLPYQWVMNKPLTTNTTLEQGQLNIENPQPNSTEHEKWDLRKQAISYGLEYDANYTLYNMLNKALKINRALEEKTTTQSTEPTYTIHPSNCSPASPSHPNNLTFEGHENPTYQEVYFSQPTNPLVDKPTTQAENPLKNTSTSIKTPPAPPTPTLPQDISLQDLISFINTKTEFSCLPQSSSLSYPDPIEPLQVPAIDPTKDTIQDHPNLNTAFSDPLSPFPNTPMVTTRDSPDIYWNDTNVPTISPWHCNDWEDYILPDFMLPQEDLNFLEDKK